MLKTAGLEELKCSLAKVYKHQYADALGPLIVSEKEISSHVLLCKP